MPRRNFNEEMLMSDYTLLEDASRATAASARATAESAAPPLSASARSKRAILAREAAARNVHLYLLPRGFARGRRNSSHARGRKGIRQLWWHVDVVFVQPGKERRVNVESCPETTCIGDIIKGASGALLKKKRKLRGTTNIADLSLEQLDIFVLNEHVVGPSSSGPEHVTVPGKAIGEDDLHRYLPLDSSSSLGDAIRNRIIIEFPILFVAKKSSCEAIHLATATVGVFEKPEVESDSDPESLSSSDESEMSSEVVKERGVPSLSEDVDGSRGGRHEAVAFDDQDSNPSCKRPRVMDSQPSEVLSTV